MAVLDKTFSATAIVETLRQRGALPVDYLAKLIQRQSFEIMSDLNKLQREGIVKIEEQYQQTWVKLAK